MESCKGCDELNTSGLASVKAERLKNTEGDKLKSLSEGSGRGVP